MRTIGVDIGGTQLRAGLFDSEYHMLDSLKTPNDRTRTPGDNLAPLAEFIRARLRDVRGVGVGCPGPLDSRLGVLLEPPNLVGWDRFPVVRWFREQTGLETRMDNDGNTAALAEALLGAGRGADSVAFVGLSTGVGGGFVLEGKLLRGAHCNAAGWWNMIVNEDPHAHKNACAGSLNEQCSGSGIAWAASQRFKEPIDAAEAFRRFHSGDPIAREVVEHAADALGRGLANIACVLDPQVVVVGGSVALHNPDFVEMGAARAREYLALPDALEVRLAQFGDDAGLLGAALLV